MPSVVSTKSADEDPERVAVVGEVGEERRVRAPDEVGALHGGDDLRVLAQLWPILLDRVGAEHHVSLVGGDHGVVDVGTDRESQVGGQRPRRGGPGQDAQWAGVVGVRREVEARR